MLLNIKLLNKIVKILEIKKSQIFYLIFICLISAMAHVSYNILLKPVIDKSLISENGINFEYIELFLLSVFLYIIFTFIRKISFSIMNIKIEKNLNYKISEAISQVEIGYFDLRKEGEIIAILTKKIPELKNFFDNSFEKIIYTPIIFFLTMTGILLIDYKTGIIIIPGVLTSILIDYKYGNIIIKSSHEVFKAENELLSYQKEVIEDIENIKMAKNENYIYKNYSEKSEKYLRKTDKMLKDYQIAYIPGLLNEYLPAILLLIVAIFRVPANKMSYGTFLSSLNLVIGASLPFSHFLRIMTRLKGQKAGIDEISKFFKQKKEIMKENKNKIKEENKIIEMENVNYTYINKKEEILKDINMEILKNEKVAIIGKSGSGKTTLLKIILGLYKPEKGSVKVFNMNSEENRKNIWEKTGYVDNNIYLFDSTVEYNITLSDRELAVKEKMKLEKIAEALNMTELIGKNMNLNQFGSNLSGGQKLKISIARALFKNTELLIFDEPVSSLDKDSEELLCDLLSKLHITALIVTHRAKILEICDKIYEINEKNQVVKIKDITEKEGGKYENKI